MTTQARNSLRFYQGSSPTAVERMLSMQSASVVRELKEHFHEDDIHALAIKLSHGE